MTKKLINMGKKYIGIFVILGIGVLLASSYYIYLEHDKYFPSISDINKNPSKYENMKAEIWGYLEEINETEYYVAYNSDRIKVFGNKRKNDDSIRQVMIRGTVEEGAVIEEEFLMFEKDSLMFGLSIVGLIGFLTIFFYDWKIKFRKSKIPIFLDRRKNA
ncbi:MAG: hypothetical protein V1740_01030 [Candidatus Woesearchaeota archaeon]